MTDQPGDDHAAPHDDEVRRLLADARHDAPMPAAVVARLDRVLADLADEPDRAGVRPIPNLATRRRRVTQLLVAAAAVVVVGVGVGEVLDRGAGSENDSLSTAEDEPAADSASGFSDDGSEGAIAGEAAPEAAEEPADGAQRDKSGKVWRLRSSDFQAGALTASMGYSPEAFLDGRLDRRTALVASCRAREWGRGAFVPVTYDGAPGVLVFRRALGDTQVADLFLCGSPEPLRSVTLPAP